MKAKSFALLARNISHWKEALKGNQDIEHGDAKIAMSIEP